MINITKDQLNGMPVRIGRRKNGDPIYSVMTKGGYQIVMTKNSKGAQILGASPHIAVSKHIAKKNCSDIEYSEFSKSENFDAVAMKPVVDLWISVTERLVNKLG
jgi:hypothetical protein